MLRNFYFRKELTYAHTEGEIKARRSRAAPLPHSAECGTPLSFNKGEAACYSINTGAVVDIL